MDSVTPASASSASKKEFTGGYYKGGDSGFFQDDPRYRRIEQEEALKFLTNKDGKWFFSQYSGQLAPSGYLLDRDGVETATLPTQAIGVEIRDVEAAARQRFNDKYPEDAGAYAEKEKTRAYSDERSDPAYQAMEKATNDAVTRRLKNNEGIPRGMKGLDASDYVRSQEEDRAAQQFAEQYPEKAEAYAKRAKKDAAGDRNRLLQEALDAKKQPAAGSAARRLSEDQLRQAQTKAASAPTETPEGGSNSKTSFPKTVAPPLAPATPSADSPRPLTPRQGTGLPKIDGRTPQPEGENNSIKFGPKQQAHTLGNLIGSQQMDARRASSNEGGPQANGGGSGGYPSSVLDAAQSNNAIPDDSWYADDEEDGGGGDDEETDEDDDFQGQQASGLENQEHFLGTDEEEEDGWDEEGSGDGFEAADQETEFDQDLNSSDSGYVSSYADAPPNTERGEREEKARQQGSAPTFTEAGRRLAMLLADPKTAATSPEEEDEETRQAQQAQGGATTPELYEMLQRVRRLTTAASVIGFVWAFWEIHLVAYNRVFHHGSIKILPGKRPDGAYEANPNLRKSDWIDGGLSLIMILVAVIGIFVFLVQMLIVILPFLAPVLGLAYLQQTFGSDIGSLFMSWSSSP